MLFILLGINLGDFYLEIPNSWRTISDLENSTLGVTKCPVPERLPLWEFKKKLCKEVRQVSSWLSMTTNKQLASTYIFSFLILKSEVYEINTVQPLLYERLIYFPQMSPLFSPPVNSC